MNPLTSLPPKARAVVYWLYALVGVILGACQVWGADELFGQPVTKILGVFGYLGTALAITAGSNLPSFKDVAEGDVEVPPEYEGEHAAD